MLAKMHAILKGRGRKFQIRRMFESLRLSPTEWAMLTWAEMIESYEDVPDIYKSFFKPLLANGQAFPYTVLTPAFSTSLYQITEKLVCTFDHAVHILEGDGNTWVEQCYPFDGISHVMMKTVWLESRIKISGMTKQGIPASSIMRFNMATDFLLTPIIREIRLNAVDATNVVRNSELEKFDLWDLSNYKFMNFARHSLLGVEKVIYAMLQPEIRASGFNFFGVTFSRTVSPAHAVILSDREMIMIQEEVVGRDDVKYGVTWDYIPLNKITGLSFSRKDDNLLILFLQLPENEHLEYPFQISMRGEIDLLLKRFRELKCS
jgi:hypothetical protein